MKTLKTIVALLICATLASGAFASQALTQFKKNADKIPGGQLLVKVLTDLESGTVTSSGAVVITSAAGKSISLLADDADVAAEDIIWTGNNSTMDGSGNFQCDGSGTIGGTLAVTGAQTFTGATTCKAAIVGESTLAITGTSTLTGAVSVGGDITSVEAGTFTIGSTVGQALSLVGGDGAAASNDVLIDGQNFDVDASGNLDISGTITAGSGSLVLNAAAGHLVGTAFLSGTGGTSLADPGANSVVTTTVTVTGATAGDYCTCAPSTFTGLVLNEGIFMYTVSAADTVTVTYLSGASHQDPDGAGTWDCIVIPD